MSNPRPKGNEKIKINKKKYKKIKNKIKL